MPKRPRIGVLYSRVRVEEKWLFAALEERPVDYDRIDDRQVHFDLEDPGPWQKYDAVLARSISQTRGLYATRMLNAFGVPTVNSAAVAEICGDKLATSTALTQAGVPQPHCKVAFTAQSALEAIETFGYPVVLKPLVGSWGRLLAKINDRDAAEAILEHKATLGSVQHSIFYLQEYVEKPERDIRVFMLGEQPINAMYRQSSHWITNTARGGTGTIFSINDELEDICVRAVRAVGGGALAVDLIEHPERGYLVNEINHTMEFHTAQPSSGDDMAGMMVDYVIEAAKSGRENL